jgi:hypothetical protein
MWTQRLALAGAVGLISTTGSLLTADAAIARPQPHPAQRPHHAQTQTCRSKAPQKGMRGSKSKPVPCKSHRPGHSAKGPAHHRRTAPKPHPGTRPTVPVSRRPPRPVTPTVASGAVAPAAGEPTAQPQSTPNASVAIVPATQATLNGGMMTTIGDSAATNGAAVNFGWNGTAHFQVKLPSDADTITLRVRGSSCSGVAPAYSVTVDNAPLANDTAPGSAWTTRSYNRLLLSGTHIVDITFTNATYVAWPSCLRNLYLDNVTFSATSNVSVPTNPAIPAGFVHQSGTQLLDGANQPLKLRGVNLGGYLSWEGWIWGQGFDYIGQTAMLNNLTSLVGPAATAQFQQDVENNYITAQDFRALGAYGYNAVRLPFNYHLLEDDSNPGVYKQAGWDVLDRIIQEAKQNNIYVIPVMQAAPCGQGMGFVSDYTGPSLLWWSPQCQDRTVAIWRAIAQRYANENTIAGYDLIGEPYTTDQSLVPFYQRLTSAIRSVDTNHTIIYEGNAAALSFTGFTAPFDSNEMISPHDYPWEEPSDNLTGNLATYGTIARQLNAPLYIGEFGQGSYSTLAQQVSAYNADPLIAGWTDWTYKQSPGLPALQTIQHTPASQMLIDWVNNPARSKPTVAQAQQGMSDFINAIRFANTIPDAEMQRTLR